MHQLIGEKLGITGMIDHINGIKTDNRRANLRPADKRLNAANMRKHRDNTSGYKGVQWQDGRWVMFFTDLTGKRRWGGSFETAEDAAVAYDLKATSQYGEYALPNVVDPSAETLKRVKERMMSAKQRKGKSRFFGVSWDNRPGCMVNRWRGRFKHEGKICNVGYFAKEEEAAKAVDVKLIQLGNQRRLNFPED